MQARRTFAVALVALGFACSATANPAPDAQCSVYCDRVVAASCDIGTVHSACMTSCSARSSQCGGAFTGLLACALRKGSVVCQSTGGVGVDGCPQEVSNNALCDECQSACKALGVDTACGVDLVACAKRCALPDSCALRRRALADCIVNSGVLPADCSRGTPLPKGFCASEVAAATSCDPTPLGVPSTSTSP